MQQFIEKLREDLGTAIRKHSVKNFSQFLKTLESDRLIPYFELMVLYGNEEQMAEHPELLQKAIILYSTILLLLEEPNPKLEVKMDGDGEWLIRLVYLLGLEKMRRSNIIEDYDGFLKDGQVTQKMGSNFVPYLKHIFMTMTEKEKERYVEIYGEDFLKNIDKDFNL